MPSNAATAITGRARLTSRRAPASLVNVVQPVKLMAIKIVKGNSINTVPAASRQFMGTSRRTLPVGPDGSVPESKSGD